MIARTTDSKTINQKWREGFVVGYDCIAYGNGEIVFTNAYSAHDPNTHENFIKDM